MTILGRIQSFARSALGIRDAAPPPQVQTAGEAMRGRWGRWDSKTVDSMSQGHWQKATGLPINAELAYASNWLRAQAEYEISSNPVMEGMVNSYIVDVVGPDGPNYRVTSSDSDYNRRREKIWRNWWRHAGANRQLSGVEILASWVRSLWKAGEFGTQLINDPNAPGPVKLRLLPVHMHRLLTPPEFLGDPAVALGVRRDENRNPVAYYISEPYIFGPFEVYTGEFYEIRYEDFIHGFEQTEEDQVRGVPWLASCLDVMGQLRDWDKAMLDAAEMMAKTGVLWQLKNPDSGAPIAVQPGTSSPMQRGVHTFGPPGYEAEQLAPSQPSQDQQSWRAEKKAELGRGRCMPAMIINLDSSKHNYSSVRFDNQPYWRSVAMVQGWIGRNGLDRIEYAVMREAELAGEIEEAPDDAEHSWGWIKPAHVDPTKEFMAERGYLQNGTLTWSEAVISHGKDPDRVLEQSKADAKRLADAGLPAIPGIPDPSKAAGAGTPGKSEAGPQANGNGKSNGTIQPGRGLPLNGRLRERWVTVDDHPVLIKDGSGGDKGPSSLLDHIEKVGKEREASEKAFKDAFGESNKTSLSPNSRSGRAIYEAAAEHGLEPEHLAEAVAFTHEMAMERFTERESAKTAARELTGLTAGDVSRMENSGFDYASHPDKIGGATGDKMRNFDQYAQEIAARHPGVIGNVHEGHTSSHDFSRGLWDLIREGKQRAPQPHDHDIMRDAVNIAHASRSSSHAHSGVYEEDF